MQKEDKIKEDRFKKVDDALSLKLLSNVLKTLDLFIERYSKDSKKKANHQYLFDFISAAPKIIIEAAIFLAVLMIISFVTHFLKLKKNITDDDVMKNIEPNSIT